MPKTQTEVPKEMAHFKMVGVVTQTTGLATSAGGTPYCRTTLEVHEGKYPLRFFVVGFREGAEQLGAAEPDDVIEVIGLIQRQRRQSGEWDWNWVVTSAKVVAQALANDRELVAKAIQEADEDSLPF